jgi:hypothetical protein
LTEIEATAGFIDYSVVDAGGGVLLTISVFADQTSVEAGAKLESAWIAKHAAKHFPAKPTALAGEVIRHTDLVIGCACSTGTQDPCGSDKLICCAAEDSAPGAKGACVTAATICGAPATPTATSTATSTPEVAATATAVVCSAEPGDACQSDADCCVGTCGQGVCYCTDPSRPEVGCPCMTGDDNACGGNNGLCCPDKPGAPAEGTCASPMAGCDGETGCREDGYACPTTCKAGESCPKDQGGCCSGACLNDGTCGASSGTCANAGASCTAGGDCCSGKCSDSGRCYCTDPDRPGVGCPCTDGDATACGGNAQLCCKGTCLSPMASCV